jgi:hypothetical protein
MITLVPVGGLCNRLRAIASVADIATNAGQKLKIKWWRTDDLNCAFDALFDVQAFPFEVVQSNLVGWRGDWIKAAAYGSDYLQKVFGGPVLTEKDSVALVGRSSALGVWAARRKPRIRTSLMLCDARNYCDIFVPAREIRHEFAPWCARVTNAIGVHVRRTDNKKSLQHSSIERFISAMHSEIIQQPAATFFLSSDSPETFDLLAAEFGDRVFQREKRSFDRGDPAAIQDALIDLLCLGGCRKLLGSYWSSFSDVAWRLRGIDHVIVTDGNQPIEATVFKPLRESPANNMKHRYPW